MLKIKNGKKKVRPNTRYPNDVRMAIEMDQGYPLTTTQDVTLEQMAAEEHVHRQASGRKTGRTAPRVSRGQVTALTGWSRPAGRLFS